MWRTSVEDQEGSNPVVTYTNTRGTTYFLCSVPTKTAKSRLVASRTPTGTPLADLPEGYQFVENINGLVSVRKIREPLVQPGELDAVRAALAAAPGCESYRAAIERDAIVIYQPLTFPAEMEALVNRLPYGEGMLDRLRSFAAENARYSPLVRLVLTDRTRRTFDIERRYFSGDEGWLPVEWDRRLEPAVRKAVKRLGPKGPKDAFFEWE